MTQDRVTNRVLDNLQDSILIRLVRRMYTTGDIITDGMTFLQALRSDPVRKAIDYYERPRYYVEY